MAGSLCHIVNSSGQLDLSLVENGRDQIEALEECFDLIAAMVELAPHVVVQAAERAKVRLPGAAPKVGQRAYRLTPPSSYDWTRGGRR